MSTVESLIKYSSEGNQNIEENKVNFDNFENNKNENNSKIQTVDKLLKYFGEENQNIEENKASNFANNKIENNSEIKLNLIDEILYNNEKNSLNNKEINKIISNNVGIYNNLNKNEKEEINKKGEEEQKENSIEIKNQEKKETKESEKEKININNGKQLLINDIISNDLYNNLYEDNNNDMQDNQEKVINKEENIKDEYERERAYSFRPKKLPGTPSLNTKEETIKINEFKLEKEKNETKSKEINNIPDNPSVFAETIQTKIENNENYLISLNDQINNNNKVEKKNQSFEIEKNEENNNDESEDNTYKEEEDFLKEEELKRRKKVEININKEEKKEDNVVDVIEERKEEEEEDHEEENKNNNNEKNEEEAQRKYLEAQDKKKQLKKMRDEMNVRTSNLRESIEQKKKLLEKLNKEKNDKKIEEEKNNKKNEIKEEKDNEKINEKEVKQIKEIKKENKNDITKNKKYGEKINAKKKQLSSTVFNRLYNNDKKKEKVNNNINNNIKKTEKNNIKNNNKKYNKVQENEILQKTFKKKIDTIIINDTSSEENNILNNSQRVNHHFPMINDLKKEVKNNPPKNHKKEKTNQNLFVSNSFIQKFLDDSKNLNSSKKLEQFNKPIVFDDSQYETFSFRPEINQKSKDLCKKKFQKKKNSSPANKQEISTSYIENRRINAPIGELLYEDATIKKQKLENICITEKINAKKDGNKSFISQGSKHLLLKKNELKLNEIVEKYSKKNNGKLSIINVIQILWDIHILRDFLKNSSKSTEELNFDYARTIVEGVINKKNKGKREMEEIEFIEQFWIKINPIYENEKDLIEKEKLGKFLKLLFSLNEQTEINKIIKSVENFLKSINKNEASTKNENKETNEIKNTIENLENTEKENTNSIVNDNNSQIQENKDNTELQEKNENEKNDNINNENKIENKENNQNDNNEKINNLIDVEEKEINSEKKENEEKNNEVKNDEIKENNIIINNNQKNNVKKYFSLLRKKEFEKNELWTISKFLKIFFELKKLLSEYQSSKKDKIMENIIREREKELTFQPDFNATSSYFRKKNKNEDLLNTSISSNMTNKTNKPNKKKHDFNKLYEEFMMKKQMHERALMILREKKEKREIRMCTDRPKINNEYIIKNRKKTPEKGCTRNEFLYNLNKDILNRKKEKLIERENEYNNKEKYPFRPNISNNETLMNKSFMDGPKKKPRGSEEYIKRNRSVIQFKRRERDKENNRIIGSNYEKLIRQKFNLPKIKDLEPNTNILQQKEEDKKEIQNNNKGILEKENKGKENNKDEDIKENNDNDVYFTIQVKTAKGRIKPLKIYINNNPIETANKFCDENNIKKVTRDKIIQKIKELKEVYKELAVQGNKQ